MRNIRMKEVKLAFIQTVPVMPGYLFLGFAFGLMMQNAGYHFIWVLLSSLLIYAGSMQFVLVTLLSGGASLIRTAVMTLFINGRHIFYGLSFVDKFRKMGKLYPYMVFSLTDETYSVLCGLKVPKEINEKRVLFLIALMNQLYWITGSVLGGVLGQLVVLDASGIDFSMTALFVVIVINQWTESENHRSTLTGFGAAVPALLILGADQFLLPALAVSVMILMMFKKEKKG